MPRLIWVFAGHTFILLVLSCRGSNTLLICSGSCIGWSLSSLALFKVVFCFFCLFVNLHPMLIFLATKSHVLCTYHNHVHELLRSPIPQASLPPYFLRDQSSRFFSYNNVLSAIVSHHLPAWGTFSTSLLLSSILFSPPGQLVSVALLQISWILCQ